jgi:hypothetical protein
MGLNDDGGGDGDGDNDDQYIMTGIDESRRRLLSVHFHVLNQRRQQQQQQQQVRYGHCDASLAWRAHDNGCTMQDLSAAGKLLVGL